VTAHSSRRAASIVVSTLLALCVCAPRPSAAEPARSKRAAAAGATDSVARRLCDALHTLPDTRRAACCAGTANGGGLAEACTRTLGDALARGAIVLESGDADRCVADAARALDGCDWVTPQAPRLPASCRSIVHGRIAAGASCRSSLECADGLVCWGASAKVEGVCAPPGATGASCGHVDDTLATSVRASGDERHPECAGFCRYGRCAARGATGAACATSDQCVRDAHCAAGRCVAGPGPGSGEDCSGAACADGLACVDGRCAAPRKAGESCARPSDCAATCLPPGADRSRVCGMQCDAFPAALRLPPTANTTSVPHSAPHG
jgi:hypothetical protein